MRRVPRKLATSEPTFVQPNDAAVDTVCCPFLLLSTPRRLVQAVIAGGHGLNPLHEMIRLLDVDFNLLITNRA